MLPNRRLREISQKNAEFEKEAPYNFCDRWCERCVHEKQIRCTLYKDELERKVTCIAHGRDPDDPEMSAEIMEKQYEDSEDGLEEYTEESEIDFNEIDTPEFDKIKEHIKFVENNPLNATAEQYRKKARAFLDSTFLKKEAVKPELVYDFETVAWYHTLLPAKLQRALAGFHEPACEGDFALYDAIAQFEVCKKAIRQSVATLRKIDERFYSYHSQILELVALLRNMNSRIEMLEESL